MRNGDLIRLKLAYGRYKTHLNYLFIADDKGEAICPIIQGEIVLTIDLDWVAPLTWSDSERHSNILVLYNNKIVAVSKQCIEDV